MLADGSDVIKPDVSAPGVAILAATHNGPRGGPDVRLQVGHLDVVAAGRRSRCALPRRAAAGDTRRDQVGAHDDRLQHGQRRRLGRTPIRSRRAPVTSTRRSTSTRACCTSTVPPTGRRTSRVHSATTCSRTSTRSTRATSTSPRSAIGTFPGPQTVTRSVTRDARPARSPRRPRFRAWTSSSSRATLTFGAAGETESFTVTLHQDRRGRRGVDHRVPHLDVGRDRRCARRSRCSRSRQTLRPTSTGSGADRQRRHRDHSRPDR